MGTTNLQHTEIQDSSKHSAMQITLLINIAAELHAIRLLLNDLAAHSSGQTDSAEKIATHSEHVSKSHAEDLARALFSDYK